MVKTIAQAIKKVKALSAQYDSATADNNAIVLMTEIKPPQELKIEFLEIKFNGKKC